MEKEHHDHCNETLYDSEYSYHCCYASAHMLLLNQQMTDLTIALFESTYSKLSFDFILLSLFGSDSRTVFEVFGRLGHMYSSYAEDYINLILIQN